MRRRMRNHVPDLQALQSDAHISPGRVVGRALSSLVLPHSSVLALRPAQRPRCAPLRL